MKIQIQQQRDRHRLSLHTETNSDSHRHAVAGSIVETLFFLAAAIFQVQASLLSCSCTLTFYHPSNGASRIPSGWVELTNPRLSLLIKLYFLHSSRFFLWGGGSHVALQHSSPRRPKNGPEVPYRKRRGKKGGGVAWHNAHTSYFKFSHSPAQRRTGQ